MIQIYRYFVMQGTSYYTSGFNFVMKGVEATFKRCRILVKGLRFL